MLTSTLFQAILGSLVVIPGVLAQGKPEFCIDKIPGGNPKTCYTNWPTRASVCPKHPYWNKPYGYITPDKLASVVRTPDVTVCGIPDKSGRRRCETDWWAPDEKQTKILKYATLWTYKTEDKFGVPSFYFGGLYWNQDWDHPEKGVSNWCLRCDQDRDCDKYPKPKPQLE